MPRTPNSELRQFELRPAFDTINVHLPAQGLDLDGVNSLVKEMLNLVGCPKCFSGRNFAFLHMKDIVVNPAGEITQIPGVSISQL